MLCYKLLISSLSFTVNALLGCFPKDLSGGIDNNCKDAFMGFYQRGFISHDQEKQATHESVSQYLEELDYKVPSSWNLITMNCLVVSNSILSDFPRIR